MADHYVYEKHDVGLLRSDGTTKIGLMLATDKNGKPLYNVTDDKFIVEQRYTSSPDYGALDPEKEIALIRSDWRGGMGLDYYDSSDPTRYRWFDGYIDARFKNRIIAGPTATAITLPSMWTITDGGLEDWASASDLTSWVETSQEGSVAREAATIHGGTYSAKLTVNGIASNFARITQVLGGWTTDFRNTTVTVKAWMYSSVASNARIGINDGVGTTYSSYHTGVAGWEELTVTRKLSATATQIQLIGESIASASGSQASYVDDWDVLSTGNITCSAEFDSDLLFGGGNLLYRMNNSTGAVTIQASLPYTITDLAAFTDDNLYVAQSDDYNYWYMNTSETFTESNLANNAAEYFCAVGTTLWKAALPRTLRSATDPTNGAGAWSGTTTVDSSDNNITDMIAYNNLLHIMKEDRPFYLDSSNAVQILTNQTRYIGDSTSGQYPVEWDGKLYMIWGDRSLLEDNDGTFTWRTPAAYATSVNTGTLYALAGDDQWLFAVSGDGTDLFLLAGRNETIGGSTRWVWHSIVDIASKTPTYAFTSNIYKKRLYISTSAGDLYRIWLPTSYDNYTADTERAFTSAGYIITPYYGFDFNGDQKAAIKVTLTLGHAYDANIYFSCAYQKYGDSTWTSIGNFDGTATSRIETIYVPDDASSNHPVSRFVRFRLTAVTDTSNTTPILENFDCRAILYPPRRRIIDCIIRSSDDITDKKGGRLDANAATIGTVIDEAADATWPITFYDISGTTKTVRLLPVPDYNQVARKYRVGDDERIESWYHLRMQEVPLS